MSCGRKQPIVTGINEKGDLIWGEIDMPRWQMELLRLVYYGDFLSHWTQRMFRDITGHESEEPIPSAVFTCKPMSKEWKQRNRANRLNTGD